jgi:hypothetical protein
MGDKVLKKIVITYLRKFAEPKIKKICGHDVSLLISNVRKNILNGRTFFIETDPIINEDVKIEVTEIILNYVKTAIKFVGEDEDKVMVYLNKTQKDSHPYNETISDGKSFRVFTESVDDGELKWHRDRETRMVEVIESNNWKLQIDNELPITLVVGEKYLIPEGVYHRIIKGNGDLKVSISFTY